MKKLYLILTFIFIIINLSYSITVVNIIDKTFEGDSRNNYYVKLLNLALSKTENKYGKYKINQETMDVSQSRVVRELQKGNLVNLMWTMTSKERESQLLAIRIPLLKGLMGNRIFIIHKDKQNKFININKIEDLNNLFITQGHDWPDTKILISNGINVEKIVNYENFFYLLKNKRVDAFPRGVMEPWNEIEQFGDNLLTVENEILLRYFAPMYFFVNKDDTLLAERIEEGLNLAINDGSFDELFYLQPSIQKMFNSAKLNKRKIFELNNPLLTPETKAISSDKKYIYNIGDEVKFYKKHSETK